MPRPEAAAGSSRRSASRLPRVTWRDRPVYEGQPTKIYPMKTLSPLLGLFLFPLCLIRPADAAVDPSIIPADARWVVYADLNALRASTVGKQLIAVVEKEEQLDQGKSAVGIDVQKVFATVGTATAYGTNFSSDPNAIDGTLVLQGTPDLRKIAESILLQATIATPDGFSEITDLPFPAYAVHPKKHGEVSKGEVIVAFPPEPIVVVSKSRAQLLKARDLFRDHKGSVAKANDAPLARLLGTADGAYVFATSVVPSDTLFPEDQPQARILKMTRSGAIALGEAGGKTFAHAELVATSDVMADKLMKILQGMTAMMSLAETSDKQLAEFLNSASVTREDNTVKLHLAYTSERLAEMISALVQEHKPAHHPSPEEAAAARNAELFNGEALAQWQASAEPTAEATTPAPVASHAIEKVALRNGAILSLGRQSRGGKPARFDRVEITPTGGGAPLTFQAQFMNRGGARNNFQLFQFPGADGTYDLKVSYVNDPTGKTVYTVSVRQPKAPTTAANEPKKE